MRACYCNAELGAHQLPDWEQEWVDLPPQQFIQVTVENNEQENRDVYFYVKLAPGMDTVQYGGPVTLIPGQVTTQVVPAGVQIDVRIQYYRFYAYSQWCRKIWYQEEIADAMIRRGGLITTTQEISTSSCAWGTWVIRGNLGEGTIRPEYLLLGLTTNNPTPEQILGLLPGQRNRGDILRAYRALSSRWHPDKYSTSPVSVQVLAGEIQKIVNNAMDELRLQGIV